MPRYAQVLLDGVTYVAVPHDPVVDLVEVAAATTPSAAAAEEALRGALGRLAGPEGRLRAGFSAVRLLDVDAQGRGAWIGPAHLFAFEARVAGTFETTYAGEDPSDWPAPSLEGGGNSSGPSSSGPG